MTSVDTGAPVLPPQYGPVPLYGQAPAAGAAPEAAPAAGKVWGSCTPTTVQVQVGELTKNQGRLCPPAQEPATTTVVEAGAPVVVTATDVATLLVDGSGVTRQPPGDQVVYTMDLIVYTDPSPRTLTTTLAGTPVTVTATPVSYTWDWGDGTTTTTTDPGAPYPRQTVTHRYHRRHKGTTMAVTLTTTWAATYTVDGTTTLPVEGAVTTTSTSPPFTLVRLISVLTDDAEEAQGH